jgi:hypothetical protein
MKARERWVLTSWRAQKAGQVRTPIENKGARGTHSLESTEGGTSQDPNESH